jgi:hypothetical protein
MDVEETIRRALVETATVVPWIGDQVLYPDEIDHEADEPRRGALGSNLLE